MALVFSDEPVGVLRTLWERAKRGEPLFPASNGPLLQPDTHALASKTRKQKHAVRRFVRNGHEFKPKAAGTSHGKSLRKVSAAETREEGSIGSMTERIALTAMSV